MGKTVGKGDDGASGLHAEEFARNRCRVVVFGHGGEPRTGAVKKLVRVWISKETNHVNIP